MGPQRPHQQHQRPHLCSEPRPHLPRRQVSLARPLPRPVDCLDRPRPHNHPREEDSLVQERDSSNSSHSSSLSKRPRNCLGSRNPPRPLRCSDEEETRSLRSPLKPQPPAWQQSQNWATRSLPRPTNRVSNPASSPSRKRGTRPRRRNVDSRRTFTTNCRRGRVRQCIVDQWKERGGTSGTARRGRTPIQRGASPVKCCNVSESRC